MGNKSHRSSAGSDAAPALVEAVAFLRSPKGRGVPAPEASRAAAQRALAQARADSGLEEQASVVFDAMHSLSVRAPQLFVDALAKAVDVDRVVCNALPVSALIQPVKKSPVKLPG